MTRSTGLFSMIGLVVLMVAGSLAGQTHPTLTSEQQAGHTTYSLYDEFFSRVNIVASMAARAQAAGKDQYHHSGKMIQTQLEPLGITAADYEKIKELAADCHGQLDANTGQAKSNFQTFKAQNPDAKTYPPELWKERNRLHQQRRQIVSDHIARLQAALGDAKFQALDQWVRTSMRQNQNGGK